MLVSAQSIELCPICVPASAATDSGFRAWIASGCFAGQQPGAVSCSFQDGFIRIGWNTADGPTLNLPVNALTFDGFRQWACCEEFPRSGRISFFSEQVFIDMSPEEIQSHNVIKTEVTRVLGNMAVAAESGIIYGDRVLLTNRDTKLSTEPDCTFVKYDGFQSGRVQLVERKNHPGEFMELTGSPDMVLEVVSRGSVAKDAKRLRQAYFEAGIAEYWLIDPTCEPVKFEILARGSQGYESAPHNEGWLPSAVFECQFRLERRSDPIGLWQYLLHAQPV